MNGRAELRRAFRVVGFGAVTATMIPAFMVADALTDTSDRDATRDRWVKAWAQALLRLFGVQVIVLGPLPSRDQGAVVIANHRSTIDIALLLSTFGGFMVSRADLARWPLVGLAARKVGTVFVDRSDAKSGASTIRRISTLLADGHTVNVFPEGTTFPDDEVRPFHGGAFAAASRSGAPIVPVGVAYETGSGAQFVNETFGQHLSRMSKAAPTRVVANIGTPIPTVGRKSSDLRTEAHRAVQALVHEARKTVDDRKS